MIKFKQTYNERLTEIEVKLNELTENYRSLKSIVKKSAEIYNNHYHSISKYSYSSGEPSKFMNAL